MKLQSLLVVGLCIAGPIASEASPVVLIAPIVILSASDVSGSATIEDEMSSFTVENQTQVPGKTLKPGEYNIRIVDHLSDRMIVRIDRNGKQETTFLALPVSGLQKPAERGPIMLSSGKGKNALRGFVFPGGTLAEFVYPKDEAVGIAKANNTKIPAVDPVSEGRSANPSLSSEDMKMVTLWMLSPATVGPDGSGKGIAAERYQLPMQTATVQTASQTSRVPSVQPIQRTASYQASPRPKTRPVMAVLPHTAGLSPVVVLTGILSLGCAGVLARRRKLSAC